MQSPLDSPSTPFSSSSVTEKHTPQGSSSRLPPVSANRLWRPAAQRNLRNQWSRLVSLKDQWFSISSSGRSHATSLVNTYLSERYIPEMDLGALSQMTDIRLKACEKLSRQRDLHRRKLLSSYRDMVAVISHMTNACGSMKCFSKGPSGSPLVQFCCQPEDERDPGDGGGIPIFSFMSIPASDGPGVSLLPCLGFRAEGLCVSVLTFGLAELVMGLWAAGERGSLDGPQTYLRFENLAQELVKMFSMELCMKRLIVVELLSLCYNEAAKAQNHNFAWSDELYQGEFDELSTSNLYSEENCEPLFPKMNSCELDSCLTIKLNHLPDRETMQYWNKE